MSERVVDQRLLSTYLDDHVAGATIGLARVQRMSDASRGNRVGETIAPFVEELRVEREFLVAAAVAERNGRPNVRSRTSRSCSTGSALTGSAEPVLQPSRPGRRP